MPTIKGKWLFDLTIDLSKELYQSVEFLSNGENFHAMDVQPAQHASGGEGGGESIPAKIVYALKSGDGARYAYTDPNWAEEYRTIDFGDSEQFVSDEFHTWFIDNATPVKTKTLSGTWELKTNISIDDEWEETIEFTSNGGSYSTMQCSIIKAGGHVISCLVYGDEHVASGIDSIEWENSDYREVRFGATPQKVSDEFYDWFVLNAIRIVRKVTGVWTFDLEIEMPSELQADVKFSSNDQTFVSIGMRKDHNDELALVYLTDNGEFRYAYSTSSWTNTGYQTIDFGSAEQEVTEEFYTWLDDNAEETVRTISGKWVFNNLLSLMKFEEIVDFKSSNYTLVKMYSNGGKMYYVLDGGTEEVYAYGGSNVWQDTKLKTIDFGETEQVVSEKFYWWFKTYATPVTDVDEPETPETPVTENLIIPLTSATGMKLNTKGKICDRNIVIRVSLDTYNGEFELLIVFYVDGEEFLVSADYNWGEVITAYPDDFSHDDTDQVYYKGSSVSTYDGALVYAWDKPIDGHYYSIASG
jgi:hypothetical protein